MRLAAIALLAAAGLGLQDPPPSPAVPKGRVVGRVLFRGKHTPPSPFKVPPERVRGGDPETVPDETLLVNENETLRNVLVWVKTGAPKSEPASELEPYLMEIRDCRFRPHVMAVRLGQPIIMRVADERNYCVDVPSKRNPPLNFTFAKGGEMRVVFTVPEIGLPMKAVRPWMSAFLHVVPHPFFAVTNEKGAFEIRDLPPGDYELEAWHEKLGFRSVKITLDDKAGRSTDFDFTPQPPK